MAVGYSGLRIRSLDGGLTWSEALTDPWVGQPVDPECVGDGCKLLCSGGDDKCLLRDVTYANGLFVAVGWKIFSSEDGLVWTERTVENQQWMGGVEFGNDIWLAIGGCGNHLSSNDGLDWTKSGNATEGCGHVRELAFGNGAFVATGAYNGGDLAGTAIALRATGPEDFAPIVESHTANPDGSLAEEHLSNSVDFRDGKFVSEARGDDSKHYTSTDGLTWASVDAPLGPRMVGGVYLRMKNKRIERSEDGEEWVPVTDTLPGSISGWAAGPIPR